MASTVKAYPDEYAALQTQALALASKINADLDSANARIAAMTSLSGPLHTSTLNAKMSTLLLLLRSDLHTTGKANAKNLDASIKSYCAALNAADRP